MKNKSGFTLIELLIVIVIIGILMTLGINSYMKLQKNGRDAKRMSDLSKIQSALEQYHADVGYYPVSPLPAVGSSLINGSRTYLSKIPGDVDDSSYSYTALPGSPCTENCTNYCLYATVENDSSVSLGCGSGKIYAVTAP